ncbi:MAG: MBL fold metallo-hydrolase RNA specificity domain-containing protein [Kiritimatiellia bacterium]
MKLTFLGAAKNVTGSKYLLDAGGLRMLIDCGLYQERNLKNRNWEPMPVDPKSIDCILLTHAHLDHCGMIPKLAKDGFKGKIYGTSATNKIAEIVMLDSGNLQEEDAAFKKKRHDKEGRKGPHPIMPLYTRAEAEAVLPRLTPVDFDSNFHLNDNVTIRFYGAGHILGAASIKVTVKEAAGTKSIIFSGDIGRWDMPILKDPEPLDTADFVVMESTYGNRIHDDNSHIPNQLADILNSTYKAGGNVIIPSFAVERTQDLLYHLNKLLDSKSIPHMLTFLDSPMAIRVTEVFKKNRDLFDDETIQLMQQGKHPCDFPNLKLTNSAEQSKAINSIRGSAIIIAGSGMCTGGRIKHHLKNNISRDECTVLFIGYQAVGTLGRIIADGAEEVRILGETIPVRAQIAKIGGFSGHADQTELMKWVTSLEEKPKRIFVTHGEPEAAAAFAKILRTEMNTEVTVPDYQDAVEL